MDSPRSVFDYGDRHIYPFSNFEVLQLKQAIVQWFSNRSTDNKLFLRRTIARLYELRLDSSLVGAILARATNSIRFQNRWNIHPLDNNFESKVRDMMEFYRVHFNELGDDEDDDEIRIWNMHDDAM